MAEFIWAKHILFRRFYLNNLLPFVCLIHISMNHKGACDIENIVRFSFYFPMCWTHFLYQSYANSISNIMNIDFDVSVFEMFIL